MKHQPHFGSASDVASSELTRISGLIGDLDRVVQILNSDIATEEERAGVSDPFDPGYPILARTLAARRSNLKDTIAVLERRARCVWDRTEQVPAATKSAPADRRAPITTRQVPAVPGG